MTCLSWKAQRRLHHVWHQMQLRNKRHAIIAVAAGRELAGLSWEVVTADWPAGRYRSSRTRAAVSGRKRNSVAYASCHGQST
jgi:hypothetical protein